MLRLVLRFLCRILQSVSLSLQLYLCAYSNLFATYSLSTSSLKEFLAPYDSALSRPSAIKEQVSKLVHCASSSPCPKAWAPGILNHERCKDHRTSLVARLQYVRILYPKLLQLAWLFEASKTTHKASQTGKPTTRHHLWALVVPWLQCTV